MKKYLLYIFFFALPLCSSAAVLRFDPSIKHVVPGDIFVVNLRLDVAADECVNAATVLSQYDHSQFRLNALSHGESIFSLWVEEKIDHEGGFATFTAGIPAGYCGRAQGDPGQTNIIAKYIFQYIGNSREGNATISLLPETEVILNDGLGTKTHVEAKPLNISFSSSRGMTNEWLDEVHLDTFAPEPFAPEIIQDTSVSELPYYLIFHTTDKQSGVLHYEVVEEDPRSFGFRIGSKIKAKLSVAKSPYLLSDQTLSSRIVVRAYDHAGNMEESILPPRNMPRIFDPTRPDDYVLPLVIVFLSMGILWYVIYRKKHMQGQDQNDTDIQDLVTEE